MAEPKAKPLPRKVAFFWEQKTSLQSRFNLLQLDGGELLIGDVSVVNHSHGDDGRANYSAGQLKLCTKSVVFEPTDITKPLVKIPFASLAESKFTKIEAKPDEKSHFPPSATDESSPGYHFLCIHCDYTLEMKAENRIAPYQRIRGGKKYLFVIADPSSNTEDILIKLNRLWEIYTSIEGSDFNTASRMTHQLLPPPHALNHFQAIRNDSTEIFVTDPILSRRVKPLLQYSGYLVVSSKCVYFHTSVFGFLDDDNTICHYELKSIARVFKRRYRQRDTALEFIMVDGESVMFDFIDEHPNYRDCAFDLIRSTPHIRAYSVTLDTATDRWRRGLVSNFDYLMFINYEAGRSLCDLAQYPVFPHIIADYSSRILNLKKESSFRDLSKPMVFYKNVDFRIF
jgi:factor associated with neutral sphingomyelinase activation